MVTAAEIQETISEKYLDYGIPKTWEDNKHLAALAIVLKLKEAQEKDPSSVRGLVEELKLEDTSDYNRNIILRLTLLLGNAHAFKPLGKREIGLMGELQQSDPGKDREAVFKHLVEYFNSKEILGKTVENTDEPYRYVIKTGELHFKPFCIPLGKTVTKDGITLFDYLKGSRYSSQENILRRFLHQEEEKSNRFDFKDEERGWLSKIRDKKRGDDVTNSIRDALIAAAEDDSARGMFAIDIRMATRPGIVTKSVILNNDDFEIMLGILEGRQYPSNNVIEMQNFLREALGKELIQVDSKNVEQGDHGYTYNGELKLDQLKLIIENFANEITYDSSELIKCCNEDPNGFFTAFTDVWKATEANFTPEKIRALLSKFIGLADTNKQGDIELIYRAVESISRVLGKPNSHTLTNALNHIDVHTGKTFYAELENKFGPEELKKRPLSQIALKGAINFSLLANGVGSNKFSKDTKTLNAYKDDFDKGERLFVYRVYKVGTKKPDTKLAKTLARSMLYRSTDPEKESITDAIKILLESSLMKGTEAYVTAVTEIIKQLVILDPNVVRLIKKENLNKSVEEAGVQPESLKDKLLQALGYPVLARGAAKVAINWEAKRIVSPHYKRIFAEFEKQFIELRKSGAKFSSEGISRTVQELLNDDKVKVEEISELWGGAKSAKLWQLFQQSYTSGRSNPRDYEVAIIDRLNKGKKISVSENDLSYIWASFFTSVLNSSDVDAELKSAVVTFLVKAVGSSDIKGDDKKLAWLNKVLTTGTPIGSLAYVLGEIDSPSPEITELLQKIPEEAFPRIPPYAKQVVASPDMPTTKITTKSGFRGFLQGFTLDHEMAIYTDGVEAILDALFEEEEVFKTINHRNLKKVVESVFLTPPFKHRDAVRVILPKVIDGLNNLLRTFKWTGADIEESQQEELDHLRDTQYEVGSDAHRGISGLVRVLEGLKSRGVSM